jgi:hypothetical protein
LLDKGISNMDVNAKTQDGGVSNLAIGNFTGDGTAANVELGFRPRIVKVINLTDRIVWEWHDGMAATHCLKAVAAGTQTDDVTSAIVAKGGAGADFRGFTLSADANVSAKAIHFYAMG